MLIWVVGATGMLGSAICRFLEKRKIPYLATSSSLNICDKNLVNAYVLEHLQITHIINCAAYTQVDLAQELPDLAYAVNAVGVENLAISAIDIGAKVVHFSTDYVFDGKRVGAYTEDFPTNPINVYGKTKLAGEVFLQKLLPTTSCIIRVSWLFGLNENNFVAKILEKIKTEKTLSIVDDQQGRPTYAEDVANHVLDFCSLEGVFHFANSGIVSWFEFAKKIYELCPPSLRKCEQILPVSSEAFVTKAIRPKNSVLSTERIEKHNIIPRSYELALKDYFHHKDLKKNS